jgi:hypothetical protein
VSHPAKFRPPRKVERLDRSLDGVSALPVFLVMSFEYELIAIRLPIGPCSSIHDRAGRDDLPPRQMPIRRAENVNVVNFVNVVHIF